MRMKSFIFPGRLILKEPCANLTSWRLSTVLVHPIRPFCSPIKRFSPRNGLLGWITYSPQRKLQLMWMVTVETESFVGSILDMETPSSPFLFVLAVHPLCRMLNAATSTKIYARFRNPWVCGGAKILQCTNDISIFIRAKKRYCAVLKVILCFFELISSLMINFHKSSIFATGRNFNDDSSLLSSLNCPPVPPPFKYLGLSLSGKKPVNQIGLSCFNILLLLRR